MTHILVIDNAKDIAAMLRMVFEQRGYQVSVGHNGQEGVAFLNQSAGKPDLIISNWQMPLMDGLEFLSLVRCHPDWCSIPFVMMTAVTSEDRTRMALEHGANAFLPKPFRWNQLDAILLELGIG